MDIKTFGLQDWVQRDLLCLKRIATADNYADALTKNVGGTLFYRHINFIMGRVVPAYAYKRGDLSFRLLYDKNACHWISYSSYHGRMLQGDLLSLYDWEVMSTLRTHWRSHRSYSLTI